MLEKAVEFSQTFTLTYMQYQYKVVPIEFSIKESQSPALASQKQEHLISMWAEQGWEYVRMDTINIAVKGGCLTFGKVDMMTMHQLVFRIAVHQGAPAIPMQ